MSHDAPCGFKQPQCDLAVGQKSNFYGGLTMLATLQILCLGHVGIMWWLLRMLPNAKRLQAYGSVGNCSAIW